MDEKYRNAVQLIKTAILQSQYEAARSANEKQLVLYYGIGKYISLNSRNGFWGQGAIDRISEQLCRELPGLRGFTSRNLRYMRTFYEEWKMLDKGNDCSLIDKNSILEHMSSKIKNVSNNEVWNSRVPNLDEFYMTDFMSIGFTHHRIILGKVKEYSERLFYISKCANYSWGTRELENMIKEDLFHHQGELPNNFVQTMTPGMQALKAVSTFKDEYLLDFINVEEIDVRDAFEIDEKVVENTIVNNVKNFILT